MQHKGAISIIGLLFLLLVLAEIYKLQSITIISNGNKNDLYPVIKELLISFSNFNLQINKKFEKEAQNIQKP